MSLSGTFLGRGGGIENEEKAQKTAIDWALLSKLTVGMRREYI
jgi:hypothetical protein